MTKQITVSNVDVAFKAGFTVNIPFGDYSESVVLDILREGAKRVLSDGIGAKELTLDEKRQLVQKRLDSWSRGDFAARTRETGPETVERRATKIAVARLQKTPEFAPAKLKDEKVRAAFSEKVKALAATDAYKAAAKTQLDAEAALGDIDLPA